MSGRLTRRSRFGQLRVTSRPSSYRFEAAYACRRLNPCLFPDRLAVRNRGSRARLLGGRGRRACRRRQMTATEGRAPESPVFVARTRAGSTRAVPLLPRLVGVHCAWLGAVRRGGHEIRARSARRPLEPDQRLEAARRARAAFGCGGIAARPRIRGPRNHVRVWYRDHPRVPPAQRLGLRAGLLACCGPY